MARFSGLHSQYLQEKIAIHERIAMSTSRETTLRWRMTETARTCHAGPSCLMFPSAAVPVNRKCPPWTFMHSNKATKFIPRAHWGVSPGKIVNTTVPVHSRKSWTLMPITTYKIYIIIYLKGTLWIPGCLHLQYLPKFYYDYITMR